MRNNLLPTLWLPLIAAFLFLGGCQSSKELSRSSAQSLLESNAEFKQPFVFQLQEGVMKDAYPLEIEGANDSSEAAVKRLTEMHVKEHPLLALAFQLGYARDIGTTDEQQVPVIQNVWTHPVWHINQNYQPTDKGVALWKEYDLSVPDRQLPIAQRKVAEITGITKQGADEALVDYTYTKTPSEYGKFLDPATTEFKSLPTDLQQQLKGANQAREMLTSDWSKTGTARAYFRRYDDGWRVEKAF